MDGPPLYSYAGALLRPMNDERENFKIYVYQHELGGSDMPNVYVEPRPKGRPEGAPIEDYVLEFAGGQHVGGPFRTQEEAAAHARKLGQT